MYWYRQKKKKNSHALFTLEIEKHYYYTFPCNLPEDAKNLSNERGFSQNVFITPPSASPPPIPEKLKKKPPK